MPNILELPQEILERIFSHLIANPIHWCLPIYRTSHELCTMRRLRLVCRAWADWIYEHHLYRTLTFDSGSRSLAFIKHLGTRRPRAKCQYLNVDELWASRAPPPSSTRDPITPEILETLLEPFSDTILALDLSFLEFFTLPQQTIKAIGRIKSLRELRLDFTRESTHRHDSTWDTSMEPNLACFNSLILETQGLKSLGLALPVSLPCKCDLITGVQYPAITHLDVSIAWLGIDLLLAISIALKPSLKFLALDDLFRYNVEQLLPVYEILRENLEGLLVTNSYGLEPILHLSFPKLRFLSIHWPPALDLLSQALFSQSPIETIAIGTPKNDTLDTMTLDTFSNLPQLKRFVLMNSRTVTDYSPPPVCLKACEAHQVKCIAVDSRELYRMIEL